MAGSVGAEQGAVLGDLDGVPDDSDSDGLAPIAVADSVTGAGEADRAVGVDFAEHFDPGGRWSWSGSSRTAAHLGVVFGQVTSGMGSDQHPVV